jgi:hypothetical protein
LNATHAIEFLLVILIGGLAQHMSLVEYLTILRYCLMIPLFFKDGVCHKTCLDTFGEYATHCNEYTCFKYRYDMFRDVFFDILGVRAFM